MVLGVLLAHWYGLLQLYLLATLRRTVTLRTMLAAFMLGLGVVAPLTLVVQQLWQRALPDVASWFGIRVLKFEIDLFAAYTLDPFLEEVLKALPLLILLRLPLTRTRLGMVDTILLGAAIGAGFGFAENLIRVSVWAAQSVPASAGWEIALLFNVVAVPYPSKLSGLLPNPMHSTLLELNSFSFLNQTWHLHDSFNPHLVWTAIAGFGIGYASLSQKRWRLMGLLLVVWVGIDHAFFNYVLSGQPVRGFAQIAAALSLPTGYGERTVLVLLLLLCVGWWMDYRTMKQTIRQHSYLALPSEVSGDLAPISTLLALTKLPLSALPAALTYLHQRNEVARDPANAQLMGRLLLAKHTTLAKADLSKSGFPPLWWFVEEAARLTSLLTFLLRRALRPRSAGEALASAIFWTSLTALLFSLAHGLLSSLPETHAVRQFYRQPLLYTLARLLQVGMLAVAIISVVAYYRALHSFSLTTTPSSLVIAQVLQVVTTVSAVVWGTFVLLVSFGDPKTPLLAPHISSAYSLADLEDGLITLLGILALMVWLMALCNPALGVLVFSSQVLSLSLGLYSLYVAITGRRLFSQKPVDAQARLSSLGDVVLFVLPLPFRFFSGAQKIRGVLAFARANRRTPLGRWFYSLIRHATPGMGRKLKYVTANANWTVDALEIVDLFVWKPLEIYKLSQATVELRDRLASAIARERLADELVWYGYPGQARHVYHDTLPRYPAGSHDRTRLYLKVSQTYILEGETKRALETVEQAIQEAETQIIHEVDQITSPSDSTRESSPVGSPSLDLVRVHLAKGELLLNAGLYNEALTSYSEALKLTEHIAALPEMHTAQLGIGESLLNLGRLNEATDVIERSLHLAQQMGSRSDLEAKSLALLACAKQANGEAELATSLSNEALRRLETIATETRLAISQWIERRFIHFGVSNASS